MEAICSSETTVATQQTTRLHIPEDDTLHPILVYLYVGLWLFPVFYRPSLEGCRVNRAKEIRQPSAPRHPFVLQKGSSKRFRREISKEIGSWTWQRPTVWVHSIASTSRVLYIK
jgi:hypothetical protein